jgi:hypothetical protein
MPMHRTWLAAVLAAPAMALAQEAPPIKVWLNPGFFTHHFRHCDFRQDNYGPGVEVAFTPPHGLLAGSFINSDRERSRYAAYTWRPWRTQAGGFDLAAGIVAGLIDGYSSTNAGDWFPAIAPAVSLEYDFIGANVVFIPHPKNGALLVLQLKVRVW